MDQEDRFARRPNLPDTTRWRTRISTEFSFVPPETQKGRRPDPRILGGGLQGLRSAANFLVTQDAGTSASTRRPPLLELDFFSRDLRQDGSSILDAQTFNFAVPQGSAVANKLPPRGRQRMVPVGGCQCKRYWMPGPFTHSSCTTVKTVR